MIIQRKLLEIADVNLENLFHWYIELEHGRRSRYELELEKNSEAREKLSARLNFSLIFWFWRLSMLGNATVWVISDAIDFDLISTHKHARTRTHTHTHTHKHAHVRVCVHVWLCAITVHQKYPLCCSLHWKLLKNQIEYN